MGNSATITPARRTRHRPASPLALWAGLIGGGVAWTIHFLFIYVAGEFGCISGLGGQSFLGISAVVWLVLAMTVATLLVAAAASFLSNRRWAHLAEQTGARRAEWEVYMARTGAITSGLFCFIIVVEALPALFYLRGC